MMFFLQVVSAPGLDLNTLVTGGTGATIMAALIFAGKLILDRAIPSRSDARASVSMVLDGLQKMVKVLQEEKVADAERLQNKQRRIDQLEEAAEKDYDRITELRTEVIDLRNRLATKDRHINLLVIELRKLGAHVSGIDMADTDIEITIPADQLRKEREASTGDKVNP